MPSNQSTHKRNNIKIMKPNDQEEDVFAPVDVEEGTPDPPPPARKFD